MSISGMRGLNCQRWLDAYTEHHAALYTFSHCMTLADLNADGDHKLVVADLGTGATNLKLKVYKGTALMSESTLLDVPTAVVSFHMDTNDPRIPAVAVVSGCNIFVYKNMRPYFKFSLPSLEVNALEMDLWAHATTKSAEFNNKAMEVSVLYDTLQNLRDEIGFSNLSAQSQQFLSCDTNKRQEFVLKHKETTVKRQTIITCATTLKRNMPDANAVSCLVVGTENGDIFFLDPQAFTILDTVSLGEGDTTSTNAPVHMCASGLFEVEYRVVVSCRDGAICLARRGYKRTKVLVQLSAQCVAMVLAGNSIVVATMDHSLQCFSKSGKKQWVLALPGAATALAVLTLPHQGLSLVAVALKEGTVQFYSGRDLVDVFTASDTVSAILFGQFGQEEHSLVLVTVGGCLQVKILKRTAVFTEQTTPPPSAQQQSARLDVPTKTRLFLEQAAREREDCAAMHHTFQRELFRLRLETARARVNALRSCADPVTADQSAPLKMSAQVLGLGPTFKLLVTLENMSSTLTPSTDLALTFHSDERTYSISKPFVQVPVLVPGLTYHFETVVVCTSEMGVSDEVRIFVTRQNQSQPLLAALINMPLCDMSVVT